MAEGGSYSRRYEEEDDRFCELLEKLAGIDVPTDDEYRKVSRSSSANGPDQRVERRPRDAPSAHAPPVIRCDPDVVYEDGPTGLHAKGWMLFPSKRLGGGAFGEVMLGMKIADQDKAPYQRRICAIKVQSLHLNERAAWSELTALQCLVHPHIIDYYDHFVVKRQSESKDLRMETQAYEGSSMMLGRSRRDRLDRHSNDDRREKQVLYQERLFKRLRSGSTLWLCLQFANGGCLQDEIKRYPGSMMPESGAVYYARQIMSGLAYMHDRRFAHGDLHGGNVILAIQPNRSKNCLITDFGGCIFGSDPILHDVMKGDIRRFALLVADMIYSGSPAASSRGRASGMSKGSSISKKSGSSHPSWKQSPKEGGLSWHEASDEGSEGAISWTASGQVSWHSKSSSHSASKKSHATHDSSSHRSGPSLEAFQFDDDDDDGKLTALDMEQLSLQQSLQQPATAATVDHLMSLGRSQEASDVYMLAHDEDYEPQDLGQLSRQPFFHLPAVAPVPPERPELVQVRQATVRVAKTASEVFAPVAEAVAAARRASPGPGSLAAVRDSRKAFKRSSASPVSPNPLSIPEDAAVMTPTPRLAPTPPGVRGPRRFRHTDAAYPHESHRLRPPMRTPSPTMSSPLLEESPKPSPLLSVAGTPERLSLSPTQRPSAVAAARTSRLSSPIRAATPTTSSGSGSSHLSGSQTPMAEEPGPRHRPALRHRIQQSLTSFGRGVVRRVRSIPLTTLFRRRRRGPEYENLP